MSDCQYRGNSIPGGGVEQGEDRGQPETLSFVLPSFPISFNKLYDINHLSRSVRLTDQAALWKTRTIPFVKPCRWPQEWLLALTLTYESPSWLTKKGKLRRVDVQNLEKLVIDTMFAKWGTDDSRLVRIVSEKAWGEREQIRVTLERAEAILYDNRND
jgi:hypothetical protein